MSILVYWPRFKSAGDRIVVSGAPYSLNNPDSINCIRARYTVIMYFSIFQPYMIFFRESMVFDNQLLKKLMANWNNRLRLKNIEWELSKYCQY